jgi:hypothetical protein
MRTPRIALVLLALPAFALGACGGDSDEDKIKDVIQAVAKDSSAICDHASDKLLDQLGEGGVEGCKEAARGYPDDSAEEVGDITVEVDGDTATAEFTDNDGEEQNVNFVKDGDDWKVDAVE